jgi:hypothetical protein
MFMRFFLVISAFLLVPQLALAATLRVSGPSQVQVGRSFQVTVSVAGAKDADTMRAVGTFTKDLLQIQGVSNGGSFPNRSPGSALNQTGGNFNVGGFSLGNPVNGNASALTFTFKALQVGTATIALGGGSRILSAGEEQLTGSGSLTIKITEAPAPGEIPTTPPQAATIDLYSTTHPDQNTWYSAKALNLSWKFGGRQPSSVTVGFDQAPEGPAETRAVATNTASFTTPDDGVWYGHLVARYSASEVVRKDFRFQVDGTAPKPIAVAVDQTDVRPGVPNFLRYSALDDTSGVARYEIRFNENFVTSTTEQAYNISSLPAGDYRVSVSAFDLAGNASRGATEFKLIGAPSMTTTTQRIGIGEWILRLALIIFGGILLFFLGFLMRRKRDEKLTKSASRSKRSKGSKS